MNKKRFYHIVLVTFIITFLFWVFHKHETHIYVGNTGVADYEGVDVKVSINDRLLFDDTVYYHPYGYINVKEELRGGYHKLQVSSNKAGIRLDKKVFVVYGKYIIIEFMPPLKDVRDNPEFVIRTEFGSFYYE